MGKQLCLSRKLLFLVDHNALGNGEGHNSACFALEGFLDTDLQNLVLWWQEKYGPAPRKLFHAYKAQSERFFLLCKPDLPWIYDPLRENPSDRDRLFGLYYRDLTQRVLPFAVIEGDGVERLESSIEYVMNNV